MKKTNQDSFSWAELAELIHETQAENPKGYRAHFTGAWICYTCGALCDCGGEE